MNFSIITCGTLTQNCYRPPRWSTIFIPLTNALCRRSVPYWLNPFSFGKWITPSNVSSKGGAPDASEDISDLPYQRMGPLNEQQLKTKLLKVWNSLDIQVPFPLQFVRSHSQKTDGITVVQILFFLFLYNAPLMQSFSQDTGSCLSQLDHISGAAGGSPVVCFGVCECLCSSVCSEAAAALACTGCDSRTSRASLCCAKECRR